MSAVENAGRWAVPTLCAYAATATVNRSLVAIALDAERSARYASELWILAALAGLHFLAAWAVYAWWRWAPWLTVVLFVRFAYSALGSVGSQPRAWLEALLFLVACMWFLVPDVRLRFSHGKWLG
jgi:hypothetical protein